MEETNFNNCPNKIKMHMTPNEEGEITSSCFQICKNFEKCDFENENQEERIFRVSSKTALEKPGKYIFELFKI